MQGVGGKGVLSQILATAISATSFYKGTSCALLTTGKTDCWGAGKTGQLGSGSFYGKPHNGSATPVKVIK